MTPQIAAMYGEGESDRMEQMFPMDIRPQSHEIIRTWAFYTMAKSLLHHNDIPWRNIIISGWILDPDRKKMSKSKGNVVTPSDLLERYGTDAVRYWASSARLGMDTVVDEKQFKVGSKLVTKLFNAAKFVLMQEGDLGKITNPLDRAFLRQLAASVEQASDHFNNFRFADALNIIENAFWNHFTDNYIEFVKRRARGDGFPPAEQGSALTTLHAALATLLRLFAPFIPTITDEIWSWHFAKLFKRESIHLAPWPGTGGEGEPLSFYAGGGIELGDGDGELFELMCRAIAAVRKAKTEKQIGLGAEVVLALEVPKRERAILNNALGDLAAATGAVADNALVMTPSDGKFKVVDIVSLPDSKNW